MALDTYAHLQTAIQTFAMRTGDADFTSNVTDFITLAEAMFNYGSGDGPDFIPPLRSPNMEIMATATTDANSKIKLPTDYLEYREVWTEGSNVASLTYGTPSELRQRYGDNAGVPERFTIVGDQLIVYPLSASTTVGLTYYGQIPALSNSNTSNWLLLKSPALYLYGSLIQAAPYMMDDQRMATWGTLYQRAALALVSADRRYKYARAAASITGPTP